MNQYTEYDKRLNYFIKRLNDKHPTFEYVSGYTNSNGYVNIKCKKCGNIKYVNAQCIRGKKNIVCLECSKEETIIRNKINKLLRKQYMYLNKLDKQKQKNKGVLYKYLQSKTIYILKCKKCNDVIYSHYKRKKVCNHCVSKVKKNHSNKSLKKLYERDKGICYICGKKCDYEDYIYRGNTFIAGNYYPSIDHVIPLNKGGTDDWNNIKLAHRVCNSIKMDKVFD